MSVNLQQRSFANYSTYPVKPLQSSKILWFWINSIVTVIPMFYLSVVVWERSKFKNKYYSLRYKLKCSLLHIYLNKSLSIWTISLQNLEVRVQTFDNWLIILEEIGCEPFLILYQLVETFLLNKE